MLSKITNDFYIDFDQILLIEKRNRELLIYFKNIVRPACILNIQTKIAKEFLKKIDEYFQVELAF